MKKVFLLMLFAALGYQSLAATITSNVVGTSGSPASWTSGSSWVGNTAPTAADNVVIAAGAFITTAAVTRNTATTTTVNGSLTATGSITLTGTASLSIASGGAYVHNHTGLVIPPATWATGSTLEIKMATLTSGTLTGLAQSFYNVIINCSSLTGNLVASSASLTSIGGDLTVNNTNTGNFRLGQAETYTANIGGNINVNAGILFLATTSGGNAKVNVGGSVNAAGGTFNIGGSTTITNLTISGDLNITGGTVSPGSASATIDTINLLGTKSGTTGSINMTSGNYLGTSAATSVLNIAGDMLVSGGTFSMAPNGATGPVTTLNVNGTAAGTTGKIVLSGAASLTQASTSGILINTRDSFVLRGTATFVGNTGTSSGRNQIVNIGSSLNIGSGTSFSMTNTSSTGCSLNFTGGVGTNISFTNNGTFTNTGITTILIASGKNLTLNSDLAIGKTGSVTTNVSVLGTLNCATNKIAAGTGAGTFTLGASGTLKIGDANGISSTASTGSIQCTGAKTFPSTASYEFNGTVTQVTGNLFPTTVNNLVINNTGGTSGVTLSSNDTISGTLTLSSGNLTLGTNNLKLAQANAVAGTLGTSNHIVTNSTGRVVSTYGSAAYTFPVGSSSSLYSPIVVTNGGTSQTYTIGATTSTVYTPAVDALPWSWSVAASGTSSTSLAFKWTNSDAGAGLAGSTTNGTAYRYNGTTWVNQGGTTTAATPNSTAVSGLTSFTNTIWTVAYPNTPALNVSTSSLSFPSTIASTSSASQNFTVDGSLFTTATGNITVTAPNTNFEVSNDDNTWGASALLPYTGSALSTTTVYVRFSPQSAGSFSGNVTFSGGGLSSPPTVAVSGTGNNNVNYYNVAGTDVTVAGNWGTATNGSGSHPSDFISDGQLFNLINTGATMSGTWTVSGSSSKVIVGNGSATYTFAATSDIVGTVDVKTNATLQLSATTVTTTLGTLSTGSTVEYAAASGSQNVLATSYSNLTLSGGGTRTFGTTTNISGTFTPGSGFSATNGTIVLNGTSNSQAIPAFTYKSLTVSGADGKSTSGSLIVTGTLTMSNSFSIASGHTILLDSTGSMSSTAGKVLTVAANGTFDRRFTTGVVTFSTGSGTMVVSAGATFGVSGTSLNSSSSTIALTGVSLTDGIGASGSTLLISATTVPRLGTTTLGNVTFNIPVISNAVIGGASFIANAATTITGNLTIAATGTTGGVGIINNGSSTTGRTLTVNGSLFMQGGRYDVAGNGSTKVNSLVVKGNVVFSGANDTLYASATTATGGTGSIFIKGNLVHTSGVFGAPAGVTLDTIGFNGTSRQNITTTGFSNSSVVVLNNAAGVNLLNDLSLISNFVLTNGVLLTNGNTLRMTGASASFTGATFGSASSSFIAICDSTGTTSTTGGVQIDSIGTSGGRTGAVFFPIGATPTSYNPLTVTNSSSAVNYTATVNNVAISGVTSANSVQRTWNVQPASGTPSTVIALQWDSTQEGANFTRTSASVAHYNFGTTTIDVQSNGANSAGINPFSLSSNLTSFTGYGSFGVTNGIVALATEPTVQASNVVATPSTTSINVSWTKGSDAAYSLVVVKAGSAVNSNPVDATVYSDGGSVFGSGTQIGTGNYVVYTGSGNSVNITGLSVTSLYHIAVYSFNTAGGAENYLITSPATTNTTTLAPTYYYVGGAGGTNTSTDVWNVANQWATTLGGTPLAAFTPTNNDIFIFDGSNLGTTGSPYTDTVIILPISTSTVIGKILLQNNAKVKVNATGTRTMALGNSSYAANTTVLSIPSGSYLAFIGSGNTITLQTNSAATIAGSLVLGSGSNTTLIPGASGSTISFTNGAYSESWQSASASYPFGSTGTGLVTFGPSTTFKMIYGGDAFGGVGNNVATFDSTSLYWNANASASSSFPLDGRTYGNLRVDYATSPTGGANGFTCYDLTVGLSGYIFTIAATGTNNHIKGNITINSGATLRFSPAAASTINFSGTSAQTITNNGTWTINSITSTNQSFVISNTAGVSFAGKVALAGLAGTSMTVNSGCNLHLTSDTLVMNAGTLNLAGTISRTSGTVRATTAGATVNVTGASNLPAGLFVSDSVRNFIINRSGGVTINGDVKVSTALTLTSGALSTGSNNLIVSTGGTVSRTSGWVNGNLRKNVATGSTISRTFEVGDATNYTPVTAIFASVTIAGDLTVKSVGSASSQANYLTAPISTTAYVNRYWSLTNANTLAFTNYKATFNYVAGDLIGGATSSSVVAAKYSAGWTKSTPISVGTYADSLNTITTLGDFIFANDCVTVTPGVSISSSTTAVCTGSSVTFTATPTNGGTAPSYQWKKNGTTNVGSGGTTLVLQDNQLTSGDAITCVMTANNNCQTSATATSNSITLLAGTVTPSVSISTATDTVCSGNNVTFTASGTNAGTAPVYTWTKNSNSVGTGSSITFTANTLSTNDVIACVLTANNACQTTATANSNSHTMYVKPSPAIGSSTGFTACSLGSTIGIYNTNTQGGGVWTSSNTGVATVTTASNGGTGLVVPVGNGTSVLSYTKSSSNGCVSIATANVIVAVKATPAAITGTNSICKGSTTQLSNDTAGGVWSISPSSYATINSTGLVTSTSAGVATAKYTVTNANGCSANRTYTVTVNAFPLLPTIGYQTGTNNPQIGAGGGNFCANRTFTVVGSPSGGVWSKTGVISVTTPGGLVSTGSIAGAGSLTYTYTNSNGCSSSRTIAGNVVVCASRGVNGITNEKQETRNEFTMYPNPAKSFISLSVNSLIGVGSIVVTDLYGKQVKTQSLSMGNNTMDVSSFAKGIYFVSIITSEGKTTKKLVVE